MTADSQILAVDVGNSEAKFARFTSDVGDSFPTPKDVFRTSARLPDLQQLHQWLPHDAIGCFVASVNRKAAQEIMTWMQHHFPALCVHELTRGDFPLGDKVQNPDGVGRDRLAGALAAATLKSSDHAAIIIDAGSAINVDAVSAEGDFLGGAILAGLRGQASALARGTDLLPMLSDIPRDQTPNAIGDSTENAIRSGILWGTVGSMQEIVRRIGIQLGTPYELLLTGGDMHHLSAHLPADARHLPHLVLSGIALAARARLSNGLESK